MPTLKSQALLFLEGFSSLNFVARIFKLVNLNRDEKGEDGALIHLRFHVNFPAKLLDYHFGYGQAQAHPPAIGVWILVDLTKEAEKF